ncbi:hypothetical protein, partial [Cohnella sp.]|uniref:hypothetical protein n=1 Tax=Cohnella sp. TaxID=1883426 RepID=UPI0037046E6E
RFCFLRSMFSFQRTIGVAGLSVSGAGISSYLIPRLLATLNFYQIRYFSRIFDSSVSIKYASCRRQELEYTMNAIDNATLFAKKLLAVC